MLKALLVDIPYLIGHNVSWEGHIIMRDIKKYSVVPLDEFNAQEIKEIRLSMGMTQALFATCMGVSKKTVEAWEAGRNHPAGAACRLLTIANTNPELLQTAFMEIG